MELAETVHRRPLRLPPAVPYFPAAAGMRPIGGFFLPLKVTAVSGAALAPPVPVWQTRPSRPTTRRLRGSVPRGPDCLIPPAGLGLPSPFRCQLGDSAGARRPGYRQDRRQRQLQHCDWPAIPIMAPGDTGGHHFILPASWRCLSGSMGDPSCSSTTGGPTDGALRWKGRWPVAAYRDRYRSAQLGRGGRPHHFRVHHRALHRHS